MIKGLGEATLCGCDLRSLALPALPALEIAPGSRHVQRFADGVKVLKSRSEVKRSQVKSSSSNSSKDGKEETMVSCPPLANHHPLVPHTLGGRALLPATFILEMSERQNLRRLWAISSNKLSFLGFRFIVLQCLRHLCVYVREGEGK